MAVARGVRGTAMTAGFCSVDSMASPVTTWGIRPRTAFRIRRPGASSPPNFIGVAADEATNRRAREQPVEHVEADLPAGCAPRDVSAIDVVPQRQARPGAQRLELPAEVLPAPVVFQEPRRLGAGHLVLRDLRRRRADGRELHRPDGGQVAVGVERRPLRQVRGVRQRLPDQRRRMPQLANDEKCPLVAVLLDLGAGCFAGNVAVTSCSSLLSFLL